MSRLIEHLDEQDGDPDLMGADPADEDEPAFDAPSRAQIVRRFGYYGVGDPIGDPGDISYLNRIDQTELLAKPTAHFQTHEDAEDDDPGEDEHDAEREDGT